ncbi:Lrp/AsnC ligand binding domain-containing protein [Streptomyces sp. IMTB 2501]|uniref:Lrp/AsnC ligand binding domain-containing protein n=1 Tax=Streptomyces sp. IMTB 2501 TaxID=1776340 RepID=UPI000D1A0500|nr:Lrp/AsnC ligand binding domain-containing protein [Streptomyces sp. IMTB 2501]
MVHGRHVTGNYDYLLQVEIADLPAFENFRSNRLADLPGVAMVAKSAGPTAVTHVETVAAARAPGRRIDRGFRFRGGSVVPDGSGDEVLHRCRVQVRT